MMQPHSSLTASRWMTLSAVSAAVLLSACTSTPLPPWTSAPTATPGTVTTAPKSQGPAPVHIPGVSNPGVISTPVETTPLQAVPLSVWQESPEVAARFPDPATPYSTPGLTNGRTTFTSNAELGQMLRQIASAPAGGTKAELITAGTSQEGTPIHALLLTRAAGTSLHDLDASGRPTVLLIGQQHGDEPAGSEALLAMAQSLAQGPLGPLLDKLNVLLVPRANPDGAASGRRTTSNGIDMNRDHLLLQTPEADALAKLSRNYRPVAVFDSHEFTVAGRYLEKFQAVQRYDALLQTPTTANTHEFVGKAANEWYLLPMQKALTDQGMSTNWYYTTTKKADDLTLSMGGVRPDTGRNVYALKNAPSLLIETRGVGIGRAHIQRRVHSHVVALTSALQTTAQRAKELEQVRAFVARDVASQACRGQFTLESQQTTEKRRIVFLDPQTGEDRPQEVDWKSSVKLQPGESRARPCGYWLSTNAGEAADKLRALGLQVLRVAEPGNMLADTYQEVERSSSAKNDVLGPSSRSVERVKVQLQRIAIDVPEGSYYVPLNQPMANLAIAALEPDTQSSFFANHIITGLSDVARSMNNPSLVYDETD
ncbi:M14 family metallopeptidase [Comamonas odontotermitis]|uniref:M14 family metallopeptidase n=1 Tax=Comamonas odontotermitis TaxID=379895 RepID=UPI001CC5853A|nr:M14 family metallocarboxypeptidase [Comamonas odontotermitis]UBB18393.1 M14 family metallocarboxypeptidase [Comamonas odontotermitis]